MFTNDYSNIADQVKQDILNWTINWVETPNEFYDNKFSVCPYAKKARLAGETNICVYTSGSFRNFINHTLETLVANKSHRQMLLVLPPRAKYYPGIQKFIVNQNKKLVPNDYFALGGQAIATQSRYPGLFNSGPYFIIGINTLSVVLPAVESLKAAGYYDRWSKQHYKDIVIRRQQLYEQYSKKDPA
jgi:hypothetical protein